MACLKLDYSLKTACCLIAPSHAASPHEFRPVMTSPGFLSGVKFTGKIFPRPGQGRRRALVSGFFLTFFLLFVFAPASAFASVNFRAAASGSAASVAGGIVHVGAGTSDDRDNCGNINPSIPAGSVGDLLVAVVVARENSATVTMTGWNPYFSNSYPGAGIPGIYLLARCDRFRSEHHHAVRHLQLPGGTDLTVQRRGHGESFRNQPDPGRQLGAPRFQQYRYRHREHDLGHCNAAGGRIYHG